MKIFCLIFLSSTPLYAGAFGNTPGRAIGAGALGFVLILLALIICRKHFAKPEHKFPDHREEDMFLKENDE